MLPEAQKNTDFHGLFMDFYEMWLRLACLGAKHRSTTKLISESLEAKTLSTFFVKILSVGFSPHFVDFDQVITDHLR